MNEDIEVAIARLAEAKILEGLQNGAFDDLPGKGKPLELEDLSLIPEDLRVGYIMLKNAGLLPEEVELHKEITSLNRLIAGCTQDAEKKDLRSKLEMMSIRYSILMQRRRTASKPPLL